MKKDLKILTTYWFLIVLTLLLLNDFVFKELFSNWMTGKLSEFAGLFIFPLFWTALLPRQKNKIFWLTGLFFIFWKSPFSQSFIDNWNDLGLWSISRTVDYTDLIALTILPLAFRLVNINKKLRTIKIHPVLPLLLSAFSFMATSYSTDIEIENEFSFAFSKDTLEKRIYYLPGIKNRFREDYNMDLSGLIVHKDNRDTLELNEDPIKLFVNDTMDLFILEDFCFEGYEATVVISGDEQNSKIELIKFNHHCPRDGKHIVPIKRTDDLKVLTQSFGKKVIEELKK